MAIGKRKSVQQPLFVSTVDLALARPHPYYSALNKVLDAHQFDVFVEQLCGKFYAGNMGRPGVAQDGHRTRTASNDWDRPFFCFLVEVIQVAAKNLPVKHTSRLPLVCLRTRGNNRGVFTAKANPRATRPLCKLLKWRRRELNPRPEKTDLPASTCLGGDLLSSAWAITVTLPGGSGRCFSLLHLCQSEATSPLFLS